MSTLSFQLLIVFSHGVFEMLILISLQSPA